MREAEKWRWQESPEAAVAAMEAEHGALLVQVESAEVVAGGSIFGLAIHEVRAKIRVNDIETFVHDQVPISWFKRWGLLKRWDSFRKTEEFLKSDLGKKWFGYFLQECKPGLLRAVK